MSGSWDAKLARLERIPLFAGCDRREIRAIGRLGDLITRDPGAVLVQQGSWTREAFVIVDGAATVSSGGTTVATLGPGDVIGAIAVLGGGPRTATVTADTPIELLVFDQRAFRSLLGLSPQVTYRMLADMAYRLRHPIEAATA